MDPLSALSIATGVVTFVDFTAKLISTTKVVYRSFEGVSPEHLQLEEVYAKLYTLSEELSIGPTIASTKPPLSPTTLPQCPNVVQGLRALADSCKKDCLDMLGVLNHLHAKSSSGKGQSKKPQHLWASLRAAFMAQLGKTKIAELESRLERVQQAMSLHISSIIRSVALCLYG